MNGLIVMIILQLIIWIAGFFVKGFTLYQCLLIIPVVMFAVRKFGLKVSSVHIVVVEVIFLFFSTIFTVLFGHFDKVPYVISILLRILSCTIAIIDDTLYIYVTEERKIK